MIGQTIGQYKITEKLGAGGMGEVYLALHTKLDRKDALKFLPHYLTDDPEFRSRLEHEAKATAALKHPNIVTVYDLGEHEGRLFIAMEYVEGESLEDLIKRGDVPLARALEIVQQVCEGLQEVHEAGIVHRDIKPSNILVDKKGRAKILDFGLAKSRRATAQTKTGTTLGTLQYESPEQVTGQQVDARSDLFSLGAVLYELITGRTPFAGEFEDAIRYSILNDEPEPLARYRSGVTDELQRIVSKSLSKRTEERYQSVADLIADLNHLCRQLESGTIKGATEEVQPRSSIAVLPFVNMSDDEGNEYFSDGLTEELINALVKIPDLHVAARTSCFQFKEKAGDIASIGRQLKVARVLEGSVRKAGNRVRITAQLVNVADGYHLWSDKYDRDLQDIFAVQDDIAESVAGALKVMLLADRGSTKSPRTGNVQVHNLVLEGRHFHRMGRAKQSLQKARASFERAIEIDPQHAPAWAGLSLVYTDMTSELAVEVSVRERVEKARDAAERALELDDGLAEAHRALGLVKHYHDLDWQGADAEYQAALSLTPGSAPVIRSAGRLAYSTGHLDEALSLLSKGIELDPLNCPMHIDLAWAQLCSGQLDEAIASHQRGLELNPDRVGSHHFLGRAYLLKGRLEDALKEMQLEWHEMWHLEGMALVYHSLNEQEKATEALYELLLRPEGWEFNIAEVYAYRGEVDKAFEWLERARLEKDGGVGQFTRTDPLFQNLHSDSRWREFLEKIGLAD